ncbi:hypothetical protein L195_g049401, partial [Trifolium pratense]
RLKHIVLVQKGYALIATSIHEDILYGKEGATGGDAKTTNIHFADFSLSKTGLVLDQTYLSITDRL